MVMWVILHNLLYLGSLPRVKERFFSSLLSPLSLARRRSVEKMCPFRGLLFLCRRLHSQFVVCVFVAGMIIKRKSGEIPCPLAVEAFAAHLSYICKYDDKYSKYVTLTIPSL